MNHVGVFHGEREMKLIVCNIAVASSHALNYLEEWTGNLTSEAGERIEKNSMSYVFPSFLRIDRPYTRIEKSIITEATYFVLLHVS